jgi:hypothetical protein
VVINMMLVATYVHLVVDNPDLFPLQPEEPIIPLVSIAVAAYIVWCGGGAWSMDLKSSEQIELLVCCHDFNRKLGQELRSPYICTPLKTKIKYLATAMGSSKHRIHTCAPEPSIASAGRIARRTRNLHLPDHSEIQAALAIPHK